ncbi:ornithine cyclodeaminase [Variovorax sp. dw_308]|uniref:ornithine cyclodeaminase n=1 Tax=Variovorax sp. dw_308 TaxID=2721546 RepID=UPI001C47F44C|nr:ornithine cyclodeaminase [Variovorax sp. dw_308]
MTQYIDVQDVAELVKREGLPRVIGAMAGYIESDYRDWENFDKSARVASHSTVGVIELMPTANEALYAFKYVNGHPQNTFSALPTVMAFGVLADVGTGFPLLLSEMTLLTAIRTAAMSALAASRLARKSSRVMAIIGNGSQSEFQAIAFHSMLGIRQVRLYDTDLEASQKLKRNLAAFPELEVTIALTAEQAVRGADIVTTVTADKTNATILRPEMLEPGMHINAVGGDCPGKTELHPDVLRDARVVVEYEPQTRIEGDIQQMPADFPVTEFHQILSGAQPGRTSEQQVTVFDSVGFALEDFSALRYLRDLGQRHGVGRELNLIPSLVDPKDLFALVRQEPSTARATDRLSGATAPAAMA